jgi:hypothetical protein
MSMSVSVDPQGMSVLSDTDIDIHNKKTLEIEQSGIRNPETLTLTYTRKIP